MIGIQLHVSNKVSLNGDEPYIIRNKSWNKPSGGLWTSSYSRSNGSAWVKWCVCEDFNTVNGFNGFLLFPKEDVKILAIDSLRDLTEIFMEYKDDDNLYAETLNFEKVSEEYDAIHLTEKGQQETSSFHPYNLYGWDCESTVWFNWCFEKVEKYIHQNDSVFI